MATNKTISPTNVTVSIPALGDQPDASVFSNCIDKAIDGINTLNSQIVQFVSLGQFSATGASDSVKIQDCIDKITTNDKYTMFTAVATSSGANMISGYVYPDKNYGGGYIATSTSNKMWRLSNGTITVIDPDSQMARRAETRLNAGASASFTFSEYSTSALFFCTTGNSSSDTCAYVYSNGYLSPISQTSGVTVALSSDYKTVTFTNTTQRACYISCITGSTISSVT